MAHSTTLLIVLTLGEHLQIVGERRDGYVQKWHLWYKTSDISETKQSRAKVTTQCIDWWQIWWPSVNFGLLFQEQHFPQRISRTFLVGARRNLATLGVWPIETYSPNFMNFDPGITWYDVATHDMHQSFTDTLVKWFFDNFPTICLPIVLVLFLFTALPED